MWGLACPLEHKASHSLGTAEFEASPPTPRSEPRLAGCSPSQDGLGLGFLEGSRGPTRRP